MKLSKRFLIFLSFQFSLKRGIYANTFRPTYLALNSFDCPDGYDRFKDEDECLQANFEVYDDEGSQITIKSGGWAGGDATFPRWCSFWPTTSYTYFGENSADPSSIYNYLTICKLISEPTNPPTNPPTNQPTDSPVDTPTDSPTDPPTDPPTEPEYILPEYNVSSPECTIDNGGAAAVVNITCNYIVTVPTTSRGSGNISSSIHGFTQCNDTDKDFGAAEGISIASSDLTEGNDDNYQVVIQVTPSDTDTTADIKFCLHTEVKDNEENVMKFQSQVIGISVNYNTTFAVNVTSTEFEGFNATADDLGTVKFDVEAYRCDEDKNNYTAPAALTINDALYVCIKTKSNDIVVDDITRFNLKKESGGIGYNILGAGIDDFNTFVKHPKTSVVQVGTRPRAALFEDDTKIIIEGSAVLGSATGGGRYLARFVQEVDDAAATGDFNMEVEVIKAVSAADTIVTGNFVTFYGTMIGIFVTMLAFA